MDNSFWLLLHSLAFGVAVLFIVLGLIGTLLPILPGPLLIWVTVFSYAWFTDFQSPTAAWVALISAILLVTGTADLWLPILGANVSGASRRATVYGVIGGLVGLIWMPPLGSLVGYALGVLLGAYHTYGDWQIALRASLGGLAGQGIAVLVKLGGGLTVLALFVYAVLSTR